jgi:hypothetical protein
MKGVCIISNGVYSTVSVKQIRESYASTNLEAMMSSSIVTKEAIP